MHECLIRKDSDGAVRLWMRKSSQASSWLPEGPGLKVFNPSEEPIPMPPPPATAKTDAEWGRDDCESTIRAWYSFMAVDMSRLQQIKAEWKKRFSQLPPDGDVSKIASEDQLKWGLLPTRRWEIEQPRAAADALEKADRVVSGALENPPVDPLTGDGRTTAMVGREVALYRSYVRAELQSDTPAIFQADYVLLQPPSGELSLHRISNGIFLENALCPHIRFSSAEYSQVVQSSAHGGFWGRFAPKANPNFDPLNAKKGPQYIRRHQMSREEVKLYDVQVQMLYVLCVYVCACCVHACGMCMCVVYAWRVVCNLYVIE